MRLPVVSERQSDGGLSARSLPRSGSVTRAMTRWAIPFGICGALLLFTAAGCGGGGNNDVPTPTPTPSPTPAPPFTARFVIDWAARSRAINGLSSAQSARFILFSANPDGSNLIFTVNRPADPAATSQTYPTPTAIRREWGGVLSVEFYSLPDATGTLMGTAAANSSLAGAAQDGTLPTFANGPTTTVASVAVLPATLPLGASTQLLFSAKDSRGVAIALTPGSAFFTFANPGDSGVVTLTPDGIATPINAAPTTLASVSVVATVDGKASPALVIPVVSNGTLTLTPTTATAPIVSFELPLQFTATVAGLPSGASTAVTYRAGNAAGVPDSSGNSGTVTSTGLYTAPRVSGTFSVIASSAYDPTKTATTLIRVQSLVAVYITPVNASDPNSLDVVVNNTVALKASVASIPAGRDAGVTWSVVSAAGAPIPDGSAGTITNEGVYKAPATRGTYYVQAVSRYDTSKKAVLKINALAGTVPITVN